MSNAAEQAAFYMEVAALEDRLDAAKAKRAAEKAAGGLTAGTRDELEAAATALHEFRSHWRHVGAWVKACNEAEENGGDVTVTPATVTNVGEDS